MKEDQRAKGTFPAEHCEQACPLGAFTQAAGQGARERKAGERKRISSKKKL